MLNQIAFFLQENLHCNEYMLLLIVLLFKNYVITVAYVEASPCVLLWVDNVDACT